MAPSSKKAGGKAASDDSTGGRSTGGNKTAGYGDSRTAAIEAAADDFGFTDFRPGQLEAMRAAVDGRDLLAVMPSGYGKSAIYQIPGLVVDGVTLVVSPLIALQRDQAESINEALGGRRAFTLNSTRTVAEQNEVWDAASSGQAEYLFLAPEQLVREPVQDRLAELNVSLFVIDEAHCVSAWGHDFRPDYLRLADAAARVGRPPVIALTATASKMVQQEIVERLGLQDPKLLVQDFDRPNLSLAVTRHAGDADKRKAVLDEMADIPGPGLLYTATRKDTEAYRDELLSRGVRAEAYHSGRKKKDRTGIYERFMEDGFDVLVATTAFGMGIDKPNVRFVVHADIPDSLDSYYQEIGRAGRDGEAAHTMLHYRPEDLGLRRFFVAKHPDKESLDRILAVLSGSGGPVPAKQLRERLELSARKLTGLLNLLLAAGVAKEDDGGFSAVADVDRERAVEAAAETAESHERIDESRIEMTRQYAETDACRRQFLLGYFGQQLDEPCGNCDNCTSGSAQQIEEQADSSAFEAEAGRFPLQAAVVHKEWGPGTVMRHEDDRITVFFETEGYKSLALEVLEDSDILLPLD